MAGANEITMEDVGDPSSFGAPGTLATEPHDPDISLTGEKVQPEPKKVLSAEEWLAQKKGKAAAPTKVLSAEEWMAQKKGKKLPSQIAKETLAPELIDERYNQVYGNRFKQVVGGVASVLDIPLSTPGFLAGFGTNVATTIKGIATGEEKPYEKGREAGQRVMSAIDNPLQKLISHFSDPETEKAYSESLVSKGLEKFSNLVKKGAEKAEKATGIEAAGFETIVDTAMITGVGGAVDYYKSRSKKKNAAGEKELEPVDVKKIMDQFPEVPKEDVKTIIDAHDKLISAQTKAKELAVKHGDAGFKKPSTPTEKKQANKFKKDLGDDPLAHDAYKDIMQKREDFKAALEDKAALGDPEYTGKEYADFLKREAENKIEMREFERTKEAEAAPKAVPYELGTKVPEAPTATWGDALKILNKPGFLRDAAEKIRLSEFFKEEKGAVAPETALRLSAAAIGGITGALIDEESPIYGAVLGSLGGLGALATIKHVPTSMEAARNTAGAFKDLFQDKRMRINNFMDAHEYHVEAAARKTMQLASGIREGVKSEERRAAVSHWLEGDKTIKLNAEELKAAQTAQTFFDDLAKLGQQAGVLKGALDDYVTHIWDFSDKNTKTMFDQVIKERGSSSMSPYSRFAKERTIATLQEGKKAGLVPKTEDIATIIDLYGSSMYRTIYNRKLIDTLKETKTPQGDTLMLPADKAPKNYTYIDHPSLAGIKVHPDIAPSLKFVFDNSQPNLITRGLLGLNFATKRMAVSFSMFHAKALTDAFIGATGKDFAKEFSNIPKMLRQLREGGAGDIVDWAQKGGLKFSREGMAAVEDISGVGKDQFYSTMTDLGKSMDNILPAELGSKGAAAINKVNRFADKMMWEKLHTGMKLTVFAREFEKAILKNAEAHKVNPEKFPLLDKEALASDIASYTNDLFGGLNWRRVAEESKTAIGRDMALAAFGPSGRRAMQILMFAPDWTISTTRAALKMVPGLAKNTDVAKLHAAYVMRSGAYYAVVGGALNYAFSGHSIFENEDPTMIDMGDGTRMQFSKHFMEPLHWVTKGGQQALSKLGFAPREFLTQAMHKEYLGPHAPEMKSRIGHTLKNMIPIAGQSIMEKDISSTVSSFLGMPIYGKSYAEQQRAKRTKEIHERSPAGREEKRKREKEIEDRKRRERR